MDLPPTQTPQSLQTLTSQRSRTYALIYQALLSKPKFFHPNPRNLAAARRDPPVRSTRSTELE